MESPKKIFYLEISSWVGISIGAEHYYAKLNTGNEKYELSREMTRNEAIALDEKDDAMGSYEDAWERGEKTSTRFNSLDEIYESAQKKALELNCDILIEGKSHYVQPQKILYAKSLNIDHANEIFNQFDLLDWSNEEDEEVMDELCDKWFSLINK